MYFKFHIMIKNILFVILFLTVIENSVAQQKYVSPVNFPIILAGNVGELRTDAFHAGIDIKGMKGIGSPVYAVADGYVSRIGVSAWGYGNVLYVTHRDGSVSVYAHLDRFVSNIAQWVRGQQYAQKSFTINLYPSQTQFVVKQGEQIAMVGNSGSSGGAHVHFEIRDPRTGFPMNLIKRGFYEVLDAVKPTLKSIKLYEIETIDGVDVHRLKRSAVPSDTLVFKLRNRGYIAYEVVDYKDGKTNTMGVYSIEQSVNGVRNFGFKIDYIDFNKGRFINTLTKYDARLSSKSDVIRAYVSPNNTLAIYTDVLDRGVITANAEPMEVESVITDDASNKTFTKFKIVKDDTPADTKQVAGVAVKWNRDFNYPSGKLGVSIAAGSLYEDAFLDFEHSEGTFKIGSSDVPLHKPIWVSVADVKLAKAGFVSVGNKGKITWVGGTHKDGKLSASLKKFGNYRIMQDTIPPTITVLDLASKSSQLKFRLGDNLSGVDSYVLTIDGAWELAEYDGKAAALTHRVKRNATPVQHSVMLVVTDAKNNKKTYKKSVSW